jgi:hypothetical protein
MLTMRQGMLTSLASIHCNSVFVLFGTETFVMGLRSDLNLEVAKRELCYFDGR